MRERLAVLVLGLQPAWLAPELYGHTQSVAEFIVNCEYIQECRTNNYWQI